MNMQRIIVWVILATRSFLAEGQELPLPLPSPPKESRSINEDAGLFSYDILSGLCKGPGEQLGLNRISPGRVAALIKKGQISKGPQGDVYQDVDLECFDLQSLDFSKIVGTSYPRLEGFNFRGANLSGSKLMFVNLLAGRFEGAQLKNTQFGYTTLKGSADHYTSIPLVGCAKRGTSLECRK